MLGVGGPIAAIAAALAVMLLSLALLPCGTVDSAAALGGAVDVQVVGDEPAVGAATATADVVVAAAAVGAVAVHAAAGAGAASALAVATASATWAAGGACGASGSGPSL